MAELAVLTEAHRLAQSRLGARTTVQALALWNLLDPANLAGTTARWLSIMLPLIGSQRRTSATLAATYLTTLRTLELGPADPFRAVVADQIDTAATSTSLVLTGPAKVRAALSRNVDPVKALDLGRTESARAASRHVLNGGRSTIIDTVNADPRALGWARAASGKTCHFCALLAGRGPVYKSEGTADFHAHDGCNCSTVPVYRTTTPWPTGSRRYADEYQQAKADTAPGDDVLNTFRRLHAGTPA